MSKPCWAIVALALLTAGPACGAEAPLDKPVDRSSYYEASANTTDDLRRLPIPPEKESPDTLVIANARLFDGTGVSARPATIVVRGSKIDRIVPADVGGWPATVRVIDAAGRTVMPGLIDLHTHLTYINKDARPPELMAASQADAALRGVERLRYYLESGITSVRDVASHGMAPFRLKEWVASDRIAGPRMFPAGQLITGKGGHGTENFFFTTAPGDPEAPLREASGPDDWREAVREQFKRGADLIKLASHYTQAEVAAAIDEAHRLGLRVTVDTETDFTRMAVEAGADSIEHPLPRSDKVVREMARRGVASVPTLVSYQYLLKVSGGGYWGSTSRRFTLNEASLFTMAQRMKDAGVKLGVGTDLIFDWYRSLPDAYILELKNFQRLGYSPPEALVAATRTSAEILGMDDRLGTITPGKLADLIIVDGNPDTNLDDLRKVDTVIINGRVRVRGGALYTERHTVEPAPGPAGGQ